MYEVELLLLAVGRQVGDGGGRALFAQQFGRDPTPAVQFITLSTLLSILTLPLFAVAAKMISGF